MYIFEINMKSRIFDTPDLFKEKKFSFNCRVNVYFVRTKQSKMQAATQYFGEPLFLNWFQSFNALPKILCRTFGRQNQWFLLCREWWGTLRATSTPRTWCPLCGAPTSFVRREKRSGILQMTFVFI
jgi:hypothetical protein